MLHVNLTEKWRRLVTRKSILLISPIVTLAIILVWGRWYHSDTARVIRIARTHGIEMNRAIVSLEPLDSYSTALGAAGTKPSA